MLLLQLADAEPPVDGDVRSARIGIVLIEQLLDRGLSDGLSVDADVVSAGRISDAMRRLLYPSTAV